MARFPEHVNMVKADDGHTALHIAANNDHLDIVRLLASMVCFILYILLYSMHNNWRGLPSRHGTSLLSFHHRPLAT